MKICIKTFAFIIFLCLTAPAAFASVPFDPAIDSTQLQADLIAAQASTGDETINLQANTTYDTNSNGVGLTFTYSSTLAKSLTILGASDGSSVIDGNSVRQAMQIDSTHSAGDMTVRNLTFQNGIAGMENGGGLKVGDGLLAFAGSVQITGCAFNNSTTQFDGGGLASSVGGTLNVTGNTFTGNSTTGLNGGGVLLIAPAGDIVFSGNTLKGNTGGGGGRISTSGQLTMDDNIFELNTHSTGMGGGMNSSSSGNTIFNRNQFITNSAQSQGGAIIQGFTGLTGSHNTFTGNTATSQVGAVQIDVPNGNLNLDANTFSDNKAPSLGGFFADASGTLTFTNNILSGNSATTSSTGGGLLAGTAGNFIINNNIAGNTAVTHGGGLQINISGGTPLNIYNNIAIGNTSTSGQGQDLLVDFFGSPPSMTLAFNNDYGEFCFDDNGDGVGFNCDVPGVLGANQGSNLLGQDPLFINAAAGNFNLGAGSPAINAGDSAAPSITVLDHNGNTRIINGEVDMGALEAQPDIGVNPLALNFGNITTGLNASLPVTISSDGATPITVSGLSLSDNVNYSIDVNAGTNPCGALPFTLNSGETCTLGVLFAPTMDGNFDATLTVDSDDPDESAIVVTLTGVGASVVPPSPTKLGGGGCSLGDAGIAPSSYWILALLPIFGAMTKMRRLRIVVSKK